MPQVSIEFDAKTGKASANIKDLQDDLKHFGDGIGDGLDAPLGKSEGKIKTFAGKAKTLAVGFAGGFIGGLVQGGLERIGDVVVEQVQKSIEAASDLNETLSKTRQVFGAQGGDLERWSQGSAKALGLSQQKALDAASTFAVLGKAGGLTGTDLQSFSTDLVTTAADLASFANTTPQEAVEALGSGLRGEAEPLRKYGILLDDATLRAQALKMGIISSTKEALTPQQKVLASQAAIMSQLGDAQGDFARTSTGVANQQRILAATVEDLQAKFGQKLLPILEKLLPIGIKLLDWIATSALPVFESLMNSVMTTSEQIGAAWSWLYDTGQTVWNGIVRVVAAVMPVVGNVAAFIGGAVSSIANWFRQLPGWISSALSVVGNIILTPFRWGVDAARGAIESIRGFVGGITGWVASAVSGVASAISAPFERGVEIVRGILDRLRGVWNGIASTINGFGGFSVSIPEGIPGIGGRSWDWRPPRVPMLAGGAWVTGPTLAVIGEGRHSELVAPEPMLRRLLEQAGGSRMPNVLVRVEIDGQEISSRARVALTTELGSQSRYTAAGLRF